MSISTPIADRIEVRPIAEADAEPAARLAGELGYPVDVARMRARLVHLSGAADHGVFVAVRDGVVLGWVHVSAVLHVQADARAEIGGLVVTEGARNQRVGARLVARAEQWAREHGLASVLVRSQVARDAAHRFYLREGYERTKTSAVFTKPLGARTAAEGTEPEV